MLRKTYFADRYYSLRSNSLDSADSRITFRSEIILVEFVDNVLHGGKNI
jgi:hypothetical protein